MEVTVNTKPSYSSAGRKNMSNGWIDEMRRKYWYKEVLVGEKRRRGGREKEGGDEE